MSTRPQTPRLFGPDDTVFSTQGIGALPDVISMSVREQLNGSYTMQMVYPIDGAHFSEIGSRSIILAKPNPVSDPVPFRVFSITRPLNGRCTIRANHLSYDLSGSVCPPITASSVPGALNGIAAAAVPEIPFAFSNTLTSSNTFTRAVPSSVRSCMGGSEGSIIDTFGGEWEYDYLGDPFHICLAVRRGQDRGVRIRYGKNLLDLSQEENVSAVYTGVYPFWSDIDGNLVQLPEATVDAPGAFSFSRILALDLSAEFEEMPDEDQLRNAANAYITAHQIGVPAVSLKVSFAQLGQSEEYANLALLEDVELGDTVAVEFEALGVNASARVIETDYDPITGRYNTVTIGSAKATIADTIAQNSKAVTTLETGVATPIVSAIQRASERITGNLGGFVVLRDSDNDGEPDELLIMDAPDIDTATKVWRFNQAGLGYSGTGYAGPYGLAITDGEIVADFITTGLMAAERITMGARSGDDLTNYLDVGLDANNKITITLGAADNQILLKIQNDRISFYDTQDNELAYFSDNSFQIVALEAFVLQNLKIATLDNGAYGFMAAN